MVRTAFAELRAYPGRFAAVALAIALGVAFACGTFVFTASLQTALRHSAAIDVSKVDVVVTADRSPLDLPAVSEVAGVQSVEPSVRVFSGFSSTTARGNLRLDNIPVDPARRWYAPSSGRWPTSAEELAVDDGTAVRNSWHVGSRIVIGYPPSTRAVTDVAVLDTNTSPLAGADDNAYATMDLLRSMPGYAVNTAYVVDAPGSSPAQVAAAIDRALAPHASARTALAVADDAVRQLGGQSSVLSIIMLAFVILASLVAAMMVANTFTILLTQRQRQIALLRCIGATSAQVRRGALLEAFLVAVVGSVAGAGLGVTIGSIACAAMGINRSELTLDLPDLALAVLAGIIVSVLAAVAPAGRAMRVSPMAALRPIPTAERHQSVSRVRSALGMLLLLGGGAILAGGVRLGQFGIATVGGAITAIGVLLGLRVILPPILILVSRAAAPFGVTARLAATNTARNPARAASTCTALVVGVCAILTLLVAAASAQAGSDQAVGARSPLDLQITTNHSLLPPTLASTLAGLSGMQAVAEITATQVSVAGEDFTLFGPTAAELGDVRNGGELRAGQISVPQSLAIRLGLHTGDRVTIRRGPAVLVLNAAPRPVTDDGSLVVLAPDLRRLDTKPVLTAVWGKFAPDADPNGVLARVNAVVAPLPGIAVSGSGVQRAKTANVLGSLIRIALVLLGVTVFIAVLGIGNTLGLSVIERTRESALLRALGLRRRQLRTMLAVEAALLALVAAVVGSVFGIIFGWAAVGAAFRQAHQSAVLALPFGALGMVLGGAVVAGVLASLLPGRRAAKATPTQALVAT